MLSDCSRVNCLTLGGSQSHLDLSEHFLTSSCISDKLIYRKLNAWRGNLDQKGRRSVRVGGVLAIWASFFPFLVCASPTYYIELQYIKNALRSWLIFPSPFLSSGELDKDWLIQGTFVRRVFSIWNESSFPDCDLVDFPSILLSNRKEPITSLSLSFSLSLQATSPSPLLTQVYFNFRQYCTLGCGLESERVW